MNFVIDEFIRLINEGGDDGMTSPVANIIIRSIKECVKEDSFYSLPTKNILSFIEKSELKDVASLKTFAEKMSEMKSEEAPLVLNVINAEDATLDECITIISGLSKCSLCKRIGELYFTSLPVISGTTIKNKPTKQKKPDGFEKDILEAAKQGKLSSVRYLVEECHVDVETKNNNGSTTLDIASWNGHLEVVKYLVEKCHANIESKTNNGCTTLNFASWNGHLEVVKYLVEKCHANVEAKNDDGFNPLMAASRNGHLEVVKYLVEKCHANVEAKDNDGCTPLRFALRHDHLGVVEYLKMAKLGRL